MIQRIGFQQATLILDMLIFCNNFYSNNQDILVNRVTNQCYMLIQKNGTQSLLGLTRSNPSMFSVESSNYLIKNGIKQITVFVRDPISRVLSGLTTQMMMYGMSSTAINHVLVNEETFTIFDSHTVPQFWFMMKLSKNCNIEFKIEPMSMLKNVHPDIKQLNKNSVSIQLTDAIRQRLVHFYTEDIVLCNQFLNSFCHIEDVINQIKLEKDFINDIQQYRRELTYLL
jgi:hypothetical protein